MSSDTLGDLQTRLAQVRTAISNLISGGVQSYSTAIGTQVQRLSLAELRAQESHLLRRINRFSRGRFAVARRGVPR